MSHYDTFERNSNLSPQEILSVCRSFSGETGVTFELYDGDTFAADTQAKKILIPKARVNAPLYEISHQLRHESFHIRYTDPKMRALMQQNSLKTLVANLLEDVRIDTQAERTFGGSKDVNEALYKKFRPEPESEVPENRKIVNYLFALRHRAMLPEDCAGLQEPDPRLEKLVREIKRFPDCSRMMEIVDTAEKLVREIFNIPPDDQQKEAPQGNGQDQDQDQGQDQSEQKQGDGQGDGQSPEKTDEEKADQNPAKEDKMKTETEEDDSKVLENLAEQVAAGLRQTREEGLKNLNRKIDNRVTLDTILPDEEKHKLREIIRRASQTKSPEDTQSLNRNVFELAAGIMAGDAEMVFKGPEAYEEKPASHLVLALDCSGSMYSGPKPRPLEICGNLLLELAKLETTDFQVSIILWSSQAAALKYPGENLDRVKSAIFNGEADYGILGHGTRPEKAARVYLRDLASLEKPEHTMMLIITDGHWDYHGKDSVAQEINTNGEVRQSVIGIGMGGHSDYFPHIVPDVKDLPEAFSRAVEELTEGKELVT